MLGDKIRNVVLADCAWCSKGSKGKGIDPYYIFRKPCRVCEGTGAVQVIIDDSGKTKTCAWCAGKGFEPKAFTKKLCRACQGTGWAGVVQEK